MYQSPITPLFLIANDKYVNLWKVNQAKSKADKVWDYKYHLHGINQVKWNQDGNLLLSCGNDCSINVIDMEKRQLNRNFRCESIITCIDINYTSNLLLCGSYDNMVMLFDLRSKNQISKIVSHSEPITSVTFSSDSTLMISTSYDGFCRIWDIFKSNCLKTVVLENSPSINSCKILPDDNLVLLSSFNSQIQIINVVTEEEVKRFTGHKHTRHLIDLGFYCKDDNEDNYFVVSGSEDGSIYSWNIEEKNTYQKYMHKTIEEEDGNINNKDKDIDYNEQKTSMMIIDSNTNHNKVSTNNKKTSQLNNTFNILKQNSYHENVINSLSINNEGLIAYSYFPDKNNSIYLLNTNGMTITN